MLENNEELLKLLETIQKLSESMGVSVTDLIDRNASSESTSSHLYPLMLQGILLKARSVQYQKGHGMNIDEKMSPKQDQEEVDGYSIPIDPMDLLQCDSCQ